MELVRQKNVATVVTFPLIDADGDPVSSAADLDSEYTTWGDGSTPGAFGDLTNEATEIGTSGVYHLSLVQAEMDNDYIYIRVQTSTAGAKTQHILIRTMVGDPLNVATNQAGRALDVTATGAAGIDWANVENPTTAVDLSATDIQLCDTITTYTGNTVQTGDNFARIGAPVGASISADLATKVARSGNGTATSGSTTTCVDTARTEASTDYWKGCWLRFTSGNLNGQVRQITAYDAGTDTFTFAPASTSAVSTHTYDILPAGAVDVRLWRGILPNSLVSGRVDVSAGALAAGVITTSAFTAGAIDAAAIANAAIDAATFAAGAIDAAAIANGAIDAATFAAGAIDAAAIANSAIDAATFAAGAIDAAAIANGAIDAATFAAGAIDAAAIATGAIDADAIATDAITAAKIAADAVGASELATDAVNEIARAINPQINQPLSNITFEMYDSTNHNPATGLTVTGQRRLDSGAYASVDGTISEVGVGSYSFDALAADMNGALVTFRFSEGTSDDTFVHIKTSA